MSMSQYSAHPLSNSSEPGYSSVYRNDYSKELLISESTFKSLDEEIFNKFSNYDCFGSRSGNKYIFQSFKDIWQRKQNFSIGLLQLMQFRSDFILTLYSTNRIEWMITDLSTRDLGIANTALYDTLGPHSSRYILELTKSPIIVLDKGNVYKLLQLHKVSKLTHVKFLISMDDLTQDDEKLINEINALGLKIYDFKTVEKIGESNQQSLQRLESISPTTDSIYTISFTSGTTGNPKGVVITHKIALTGISTCFIHFKHPIDSHYLKTIPKTSLNNIDPSTGEQIKSFSWLPLAHIYERMLISWATFNGFAIGFPSKIGTEYIFQDLTILKPNYFTGVPRIYTKIAKFINDFINGLNPTNKKIFDKMMQLRSEGIAKSIDYNSMMEQTGLNSFKRSILGFENVKYLTSASAPMSGNLIKFLKDSLNVGFENSYGLTESFAVMSSDDPFNDINLGNVGPPNVSTEIKLKDCPELNYLTTDKPYPRGELLLRGAQIFTNYYKNPKATIEAFDKDDWFKTGDIALIDDDGKIHIIDRVKNFFKLSQGEYIIPEKIENTYLSQNQILTQLFIHGDSLKNYLVGIVGIDLNSIRNGIVDLDISTNLTDEEILKELSQPHVKRILVMELNKNVTKHLQGFEKLHNIHLAIEPLKVEDDVLTPTFKLKRIQAKKKFEKVLNALYKEGSLVIKREKI